MKIPVIRAGYLSLDMFTVPEYLRSEVHELVDLGFLLWIEESSRGTVATAWNGWGVEGRGITRLRALKHLLYSWKRLPNKEQIRFELLLNRAHVA